MEKREIELSCPLPLRDYPKIILAHGGGGSLMRDLIESVFVPAFDNPILKQLGDSAVLQVGGVRCAFTTDSYVVDPLFFPGGDIGSLAVNGTVNDLAMSGARPLFLSLSFILEEGFSSESLQLIVQSIQRTAEECGVHPVTGDTKVVEKGKGDGIYINTAGIGIIEHKLELSPGSVRPGDAVLLSGDIGRHGIAVMAQREGLSFETSIESDCASLAGMVMDLLENQVEIHCLRDLTRGGLGSALVEISESGGLDIHVEEKAIPVSEEVLGACEILGLDPLYVANEGRFVCFLPAPEAEKALKIMRAHDAGREACLIGEVKPDTIPRVVVEDRIGSQRVITLLSGEQLPRIC